VGREDYTAVAGHVDHLRVGATLEVFIQPFSELLIRKKDEEIELNLLDLQ
jgi:predicted DNA-binding protein with PD1-like motif